MKAIYESEYHSNMGTLINLEEGKNIPNAINVSLDKLITNRNTLLDKSKKYYITCQKGYHAKKACSILEFIGYDVTYLKKSNVN